MGIGESAGLTTALLWAVASMLWGRAKIPAWGINLWKNVLASLILLVHLGVMSVWYSTPVLSAGSTAWWWLGWSGVIGIVLGDTCFFRSLQILGPRRALIVTTTSPVFAGLLGWLFLNESLNSIHVLGIVVTLGGVLWVICERSANQESPNLFPGTTFSGITLGLCGALCQAIGGLASKLGMQECEPVEASFIRIVVSAVGAFVVVTATRQFRTTAQAVLKRETFKLFIPAVLVGTWLGIWLSQVTYKHSDLAIATTLLSTTPLFAIPMVRFFHGHKITIRAVIGTVTAIVGVALLVW